MMTKFIIGIGRGSSGTRLLSEVLSNSGVYMGPTNKSGDLVPADKMYDAVRLAGLHVLKGKGLYEWDFSQLKRTDPPAEYVRLVLEYLKPIIASESEWRGFKLPETLLAFPWIAKVFPDAHYVYWTREPETGIVTRHITDHLGYFNVPCDKGNIARRIFHTPPESTNETRFESWMYQWLLMREAQKPEKFLRIRYEDFVENQALELVKLSKFLGIEAKPTRVDMNTVRWDEANAIHDVPRSATQMYWNE